MSDISLNNGSYIINCKIHYSNPSYSHILVFRIFFLFLLVFFLLFSPGTSTPDSVKSASNLVPQPSNRGIFFLACYQLWRFFPDIMSISIGFLMSTIGDLYNDEVGTNLWFVILPTVFLAYFVVHLLQTGSARYNFSRFVLESAPIATMGYASYAIYLFQRVAFSYFAPAFYFGVKNHTLSISIGSSNKWFERLNGGYKVIAVTILTLVCWLVHRYYQDGFITFLYAKYLQRNANKEKLIDRLHERRASEVR